MSVLADRATIYISVHRRSKYDKVPCLRAQAGFNPLFPIESLNTLATRLTQPHTVTVLDTCSEGRGCARYLTKNNKTGLLLSDVNMDRFGSISVCMKPENHLHRQTASTFVS